MVTAVPIHQPLPPFALASPSASVPTKRIANRHSTTHPATMRAAAVRSNSKRSILDRERDDDYFANAGYSPSKRRSPPSDNAIDDGGYPPASSPSPPTPSSQQLRPLRSALASRRNPPPGSLAAFAALSPAGEYRQGMYLAFVNNALSEKSQGNLAPYLELASQFSASLSSLVASPAQLKSWLAALSHVVSALDRTHSQLVSSILHVPWYLMEDQFAHLWIKFVCSLVSARGEWLNHVLTQAVAGLQFLPNHRARNLLGLPPSELPDINRRQIFDRMHLLLRSLMALIPTLPSSLLPLLVDHFPPKASRRMDQVSYVRNILRVATYCTELSESILYTVVDRAIRLDVEIQVELDDLEEDVLGQELADPFDNVAEDDDDSDSDGEGNDLQELMDDEHESDDDDDDDELDHQDILDPENQAAVERIRSLVATLDSIMTAILEHLTRLNTGFQAIIDGTAANKALSATESEASRRNLFHSLLSIFTRAMLPTFKCRHVQFLLFWFNSLDAEFSDLFLGVLLSKSLYGSAMGADNGEAEEPDIIRSAAASYVASFVSRASYVNGPTSRVVVLNLCAFLDAHIEASHQLDTEVGSAPPGSRVHSVFYAVAQAVFYIFCFRWRDLKLTPEEQAGEADGDADGDELADGLHSSIGALSQAAAGSWCDGLNVVQRAITSPLNPLKFCSANVVKQFARIAQHTGFLYCYSIIESNNRMGRVRSSRQPSRTASQNTIDSQTPITMGGAGDSSREGSDSGTPRASEVAKGADKKVQLPDPIQTSSNLDVFFPFDPYKLQTSAAFVDPLYREWADVAPEEDGNSDDDSDGESEQQDGSEIEDGDVLVAAAGKAGSGVDIPGASSTPLDEDGEFVSQVEAMSISPYRA